jgi:Putative peptidoglycan binding domain
MAAGLAIGLCSAWAADSTQSTTKPSSHTASTHKAPRHGKKSRSSRKRGQQKIDTQRAMQIQQALIREHYLSGKPSGNWDAATQQAMQKYQADNGWQSKTTPDSRALIKLGLGPDQQHLLNPESAMTAQPHAAQGQPLAAKPADPSLPANQPR